VKQPLCNLDRPCGFQEVEVSRFKDNWHIEVVSFQPNMQAAFTTRKYSPFPVTRAIYSLLMVLAFIIFLANNCQYYVLKDYSDVNSIGAPPRRGGGGVGLPGYSPPPPSEICSHDIKGFYLICASALLSH
jgi:hypothetical protein